ncbi:hypothetical protein [Novipirellula herctigrandis]
MNFSIFLLQIGHWGKHVLKLAMGRGGKPVWLSAPRDLDGKLPAMVT